MAKNKVTNASYCIKRLRDNGFIVCRIFDDYAIEDPRRWTVLLNPGKESLFVTHYSNMSYFGESYFEFNDGGLNFPKGYQLKTDSIEVIVTHLIEKGIDNNACTQKETERENTGANSREAAR